MVEVEEQYCQRVTAVRLVQLLLTSYLARLYRRLPVESLAVFGSRARNDH